MHPYSWAVPKCRYCVHDDCCSVARFDLCRDVLANCRLDVDPAFSNKTDLAEAVHHCVLAAHPCGEVEQPVLHEPQFRMQHGELTPCLAVQELLVSERCNILVRQSDLSAPVSHPHCAPGVQGCGGDLVPRSCRMRCGRPVNGAPRSSAHRARPRLARLVRLCFSSHAALPQQHCPGSRPAALLC